MPRRVVVDHVNYEMSNFQVAQLLLPWSVCCVENITEEKAWRPLWTTDPKLRNLSMNGFAVLANKACRRVRQTPRGIMFPSFVCVNCAANPLK